MKMRVLDNSIRLRLSRPEVDEIGKGNPVESTVDFPGGGTLRYVLATSEGDSVTAAFSEGTLTVQLPDILAKSWAGSEQVGIETDLSLGGKDALHILVEKDFQCLNERPGEDESMLFTNPDAGHGHG